jgi:uncharacterized membrane protein
MVSNDARQKLRTAAPMTILGLSMALFFALTGGTGAIWGVLGTFAGTVTALLAIYTDQERSTRTEPWLPSQDATTTDTDEHALPILRQRYARGEIDHTEFERRLTDLLETETIEQATIHRDETPITEQSE